MLLSYEDQQGALCVTIMSYVYFSPIGLHHVITISVLANSLSCINGTPYNIIINGTPAHHHHHPCKQYRANLQCVGSSPHMPYVYANNVLNQL
jgi:hypothetical protein